ncbi:DUF1289 domain-containing protein [Escherichia coli]
MQAKLLARRQEMFASIMFGVFVHALECSRPVGLVQAKLLLWALTASRDERFNWNKMSDGEKQEVLRLCRQRLMRKLRANKPASSDEPEQPSLF